MTSGRLNTCNSTNSRRLKNRLTRGIISLLFLSLLATLDPSFVGALPSNGLLRNNDPRVSTVSPYIYDNNINTDFNRTVGSSVPPIVTFSEPINIRAVYALASTGFIEFYNGSGTYLGSVASVAIDHTGYTEVNFDGVTLVAWALNGINGSTQRLYELELFSSLPDTVPPTTPTGLQAEPRDGRANLSWTPNPESDIGGYNVYVGGVKHNTALVTGVSYTVTGLTNETQYSVTLSSVDTSGNESPQTTPVLVTPSDFFPLELSRGINTISSGVSVKNYLPTKTVNISSLLPYYYDSFAGEPNRG